MVAGILSPARGDGQPRNQVPGGEDPARRRGYSDSTSIIFPAPVFSTVRADTMRNRRLAAFRDRSKPVASTDSRSPGACGFGLWNVCVLGFGITLLIEPCLLNPQFQVLEGVPARVGERLPAVARAGVPSRTTAGTNAGTALLTQYPHRQPQQRLAHERRHRVQDHRPHRSRLRSPPGEWRSPRIARSRT